MSQFGGGGRPNTNNDRIYAEQSERMMEAQNDEMTNRLSEKVNLLKQLSLDIGVEVKEQNEMLNRMVRVTRQASHVERMRCTYAPTAWCV